MRVAGIQGTGGEVKLFDVPDPRTLAEDEVLIQVKAAGVADWDEIVRTGGWDVGGCRLQSADGARCGGRWDGGGRGTRGNRLGSRR